MDPISSPAHNYSNADGTTSYEGGSSTSGSCPPTPTCVDALDNIGNEAGDLATSVRDFFSGDASGRDVWGATKDLFGSGADAFETCIPADKFEQEPQYVFPTPVYY